MDLLRSAYVVFEFWSGFSGTARLTHPHEF